MDGSTHACIAERCGGGVARNMAEALWRLRDGRVKLITAIGDDADGEFLANIAPGLILDGCVVNKARTPTYAAVLDSRGDCVLGLGDMKLHNHITPQLVDRHKEVLEQAPLVVVDGNLPQPTMDHVLELCHKLQKPVFFEPTDRRKATKIIQYKHAVFCSTPNIAELRAMARCIEPNLLNAMDNKEDIAEILKLANIVSKCVDNLVITIGAKGVITVRKHLDYENTEKRLYDINVLENVVSVSGAGDCFASGFIYGFLSGHNEATSISIGFEAARSTLLCKESVPHNLKVAVETSEANYKMITKSK